MLFLYRKMLNKYDQNLKEKLRREALKRYQNLSEEENKKKARKSQERYQSFAEK